MTVRLAIIGAGAFAHSLAEACRRSSSSNLAAVVDIDADAAGRLASAFNAEALASVDELCDGSLCDGAIVCTPPDSHAAICSQLLLRDIHVLCEKPLTNDRQSAHQLARLAEQSRAHLKMATKFRYVPDVQAAKRIVSEGQLGEPILLQVTFASRYDVGNGWRGDPTISGGGVLADNGAHAIDLFRFLLGPLESIQAYEAPRIQDLEVEDTVRVTAVAKSGAVATADLSWSVDMGTPHYLVVSGRRGVAQVGWQSSQFRTSSSSDWQPIGEGYSKQTVLVAQIDEFASLLGGRASLMADLSDAVACTEAVESAYESLWCGRPVSVKESLAGSNTIAERP